MDLIGLLGFEDILCRLFSLLSIRDLASVALVCQSAKNAVFSSESSWQRRCCDELCQASLGKFPGFESEPWAQNYRAYDRLLRLFSRLAKPLSLCEDVRSALYAEQVGALLALPLCRHWCCSRTCTFSENEMFAIVLRFNMFQDSLSPELRSMSDIARRFCDDELLQVVRMVMFAAKIKLPMLLQKLGFLCGDQNAQIDLEFFKCRPDVFVLTPSKNGDTWLLLRENVRFHVTDRAGALATIVELLAPRRHPMPLKELRSRFALHTGQSFGALGYGGLLQFLQHHSDVLRVTVPKGKKHNQSTVSLLDRPPKTPGTH
eukprot:TRINITY_DN28485_c0_g1_i1.p1 TRINITY_DN28485_c0_g1~~TRINITY_DN28485_c0_g1_i1.p1  ORF type:complete len:317 (-),score=65.12 TRINITY_DN28485_c0_g1_i1:90-1040(-)